MQVGKVIMLQHHKEFNGFRQTKLEDIEYLAPNLRFEDKREVLDATGLPPYQALIHCFINAKVSFTIVDTEDVPVGIFGVNNEGAIWLLATPQIKKIRFSFLRECKKVVDFLNTQFPVLWNFVDCRNELHIKWLKWCGFTFLRKLNYGVNQKPFYEFIKICA